MHMATVEKMLAEGTAYRCYCTAEELDAERKAAQAAGLPTVYSRKCRWLTDEQRAEIEASGRRPAIRLAIPDEGEVVIDDLVRGEIRFENALLGDHVIVRSDGVPTYNLVNPLDDAAMGITHVIRGDDLLPSTPRQIHVYRAIGAEIPRFAHLSMILGPEQAATLEARRRRLGRAAARRGLPARGRRQLPRAARLEPRRRARAVHARRARGPLLARAREPGARRLRPPEAALDERRAHPRALAGGARPSGSSRSCGSRDRRSPSSPSGSPRRRRSCTRRSRRSPSSSPTAASSSDRSRSSPRRSSVCAPTTAPTRCSLPRRASPRSTRFERRADRAGAARALRRARAEAQGGLRADPDRALRSHRGTRTVRERGPPRARRGAARPQRARARCSPDGGGDEPGEGVARDGERTVGPPLERAGGDPPATPPASTPATGVPRRTRAGRPPFPPRPAPRGRARGVLEAAVGEVDAGQPAASGGRVARGEREAPASAPRAMTGSHVSGRSDGHGVSTRVREVPEVERPGRGAGAPCRHARVHPPP